MEREYEEITHHAVKEALYRYDTDTDSSVPGRLTIFRYSGQALEFAYWGKYKGSNNLNRLALPEPAKVLCEKFYQEITGKPISASGYPQKSSQSDDDEEKPVGYHNGQPIYAADPAYDRKHNW